MVGGDGAVYVVKLHPQHEADDVDLEVAALDHLAGTPAASLVPEPRRAPGGRAAVPVGDRLARVLAWLPGQVWADAGPPSPARRRALGAAVARVDRSLAGFRHPHLARALRWNLVTAADQRELLPSVADPERRAVAGAVLDAVADRVAPALGALPAQAIHNDANDRNVLVAGDRVTGLLDFGDLCLAPRVCGLAVAAAYAVAADGPRALRDVVEGYHGVAPLAAPELDLLLDLVRARLALSVVMAGWQSSRDPGNDYLLVSQGGVWAGLCALLAVDDELELYRLRATCALEPVPHARAVRQYLALADAAPVLGRPLADLPHATLDWSAARTPEQPAPGVVGVGRYAEDRAVYTTAAFADGDERRTVHLGVDLFVPPGTAVHAPLPGVVRAAVDNADLLDFGPVVVLEHATPDGVPFFTLLGHLSREGLALVRAGEKVEAGQVVGRVGDRGENGGWPPHVHLQLLTALAGLPSITTPMPVPGVAARGDLAVWQSIAPDPNLLLRLPGGTRADPGVPDAEIVRRRRTLLSPAMSLSYGEPLHVVRGEGAHLIDTRGRRWLDLVNNVAHVGHAHPRVVAAAAAQNALLNTNTRYLHEAVVEYARRLAETLPDPLSVCFFVNSGSEANDLALRLAYAHTRARDVVVLDHAYHGHLTSLIDVSPYKFDGPGGLGRPATTHVVPLPDPYRGRYRVGAGEPSSAVTPAYLAELDQVLDDLVAAGRRPAAFLSEPMPGTAGQVVLADGFLAGAYARVRAAGGVCIADEVQIGFGRPGRRDVGIRAARRGAGRRHPGQADRQRAPGGRRRDHARGGRLVPHRHGVLQHLRRQPGLGPGRAGRARRRRRRAAAAPRGRARRPADRRAARAGEPARARRRRPRHRTLRRDRARRRPGLPHPRRRRGIRCRRGGEGPRRADLHGRSGPRRDQDQAADGAGRGGRGPSRDRARRGPRRGRAEPLSRRSATFAAAGLPASSKEGKAQWVGSCPFGQAD